MHDTIKLAINADTLERLLQSDTLKAEDFRCQDSQAQRRVHEILLKSLRLMHHSEQSQ